LGADGNLDGITLKGEFQADSPKILAWLFGVSGKLTPRDWCLIGYTAGLASGLLVFVGYLLGQTSFAIGAPWPVAALAGAAVLAERQSVRVTPRAEISVSALPIVLAAVIYGPLAAICVSIASLLPSFQAPYARWLIWTSTRSIAAGAAGLAAFRLDDSTAHLFGHVLAAVAVATIIEQIGDLMLGSIAAAIRRMSFREIIRVASTMLLAMPLYVPMAALLVVAYRQISPWSVALFLFPAFVAQKLFLLYTEQRGTAEELSSALARQEKANLQFASTLVAALDAGDQYTAGHSAAVAVYARDISARLGLSSELQRLAHLAGLVHDIGKIGLPDGLLEKPGPLAADERREMEQHAVIGERILANVDDYAEIARIVRHHHERVDGKGYPDRLVEDDIPLLSRIISVADAYNAMTSKRPYRDAMPAGVARIRLARGISTQFDTSVVAAFEAVLASATEEYRVGRGPEFTVEAQPSRSRSLEEAPPRILQAIAS
jgi:putative nucleotidyltransferase with HDIG domain